MKIGVFDSGIGGLTVLKQLIKNYPNNEYIYFGDTLNLPYGTKCINELEERSDKIINFLLKEKVDIIVIACGTVSSNLYKQLKDRYEVPIIDVLTPTLKYIREENLEKIGVFATPMTIKSGFFNEVAQKLVSCPLFVPLIEERKIYTKECDNAVIEYLEELRGCKNIILGCTHYPILKDIIAKYSNANLVDMGYCVSKYININNDGKQKITLYFSLLSDELINNISNILDIKYNIKEKIV